MSSSLIHRPLSVGELLDVTFRIYRKHFWKLALTAGALLFPLQTILNLLQLFQFRYYPGMFGVEGQNAAAQAPLWLSFSQIALSLVVIFISILAMIAVIWMADRLLRGESPGVKESWRAGLRYYLRYLGLLALLLVLFFAVAFLWLLLSIIPCLGLFLMLGGLAFFLYFYTRLILAPFALVAEDCGPVTAIKATWRISAARFWRIFLYGLLLLVLALVFYGAPMFFLQTRLFSSIITGDLGTWLTLTPIIRIIFNLLSILWTPLYTVALMTLYHDLKLRKKPGAAIEQRIEALEAASTTLSSPEPVANSQSPIAAVQESPPKDDIDNDAGESTASID